MKVRVKLLGTLPSCRPGHYPAAGLDIDVPLGSTVAEVAERIGLPRDKVAIVAIDGLLAKADDRVPENAVVKFIQPIAGG